ncbi:unnamed protein product (macronuclear) [Paramecium tetraurelia]|uniref:Mini antigen n=1 Tax=Paramecium tetraurelia TaxID=5888 RepID=A0CCJ7_PARTE|nr:uncharacterized protein GSPATT00037299001 [Paramecium tetraurelia]CAK68514.1 unnamed protein product [Paramecium tetraurelia]|eukprot:XP_001435911.1 hypothetical protein (macronuclear) [Paramecium tetraurelia strain d4-2]
MQTIILIISTAQLIKSATLDISNSCKCSELIYSNDCFSGFSDCSWNTRKNQCVDVACSDIEWSNHCNWSSNRCYWFNKQCHDFTSCQAIPGKDQSECISANIYCPASNGINCLPMQYQQACSDITDPDTCNNYFSPNGKCMWKEQKCIILQTCTELWTNITKSCLPYVCYFDSLTYMCRDMTCAKHTMESQCDFGVPTIGPYLNNFIPCEWDTKNSVCREANPSDFNVNECYSNSARTYHWSNSKSSKGSCVPCQSPIVTLIIGLMVMIIM